LGFGDGKKFTLDKLAKLSAKDLRVVEGLVEILLSEQKAT
jgi:hypothetical protein